MLDSHRYDKHFKASDVRVFKYMSVLRQGQLFRPVKNQRKLFIIYVLSSPGKWMSGWS